jgi:hypothetical protein
MTTLNEFAAATHSELFDPAYQDGAWLVDAVETRESLDDFRHSSQRWATRSAESSGTIAGCPYIAWKTMQRATGDERMALSVVDLGDRRIALHGTNLDHFA